MRLDAHSKDPKERAVCSCLDVLYVETRKSVGAVVWIDTDEHKLGRVPFGNGERYDGSKPIPVVEESYEPGTIILRNRHTGHELVV